jgi:hypothetical protein
MFAEEEMTDQSPAPEVKDRLALDASWQTLRVVLIFVAGVACNHFFDDANITAAGIAAATALLTYGYGLWDRWRTHRLKLTLAGLLGWR